MKRVRDRSSTLWFILVCVFSVLLGCSSETDEQLLAKITPGLQAGNFLKQPEALRAVSKLLSRGHQKSRSRKSSIASLPQVRYSLLTTRSGRTETRLESYTTLLNVMTIRLLSRDSSEE